MSGSDAVVAADLGLHYDGAERAALTGVDLVVPAGGISAVVGPSGAGRTTLARLLAGLRLPGNRTGTVRGPDRIGLVGTSPPLQRSGVAPDVATEIAFGLQYLGVPRPEQQLRVAEAAEALGLTGLLDRDPDRLSGGEQQRLALAAALVLRPGALLLDDADGLLDPDGRAALMNRLVALAGAGTAVLVLGGRPEDLLQHATRVDLLDGGRIVRSGSAASVLGDPVTAGSGTRLPAVTRWAADHELPPPWPVTDDQLRARLRTRGSGTGPGEPTGRSSNPAATLVELPAAPEPPTLRLRGVTVAGALDGIELEIPPGTRLGVAGPNGAGKTTLTQLLNGLRRPDRGVVEHDRRDIAGRSVADLASTVGYVFADPDAQLFARTVRAEVAFGPRSLSRGNVPGRVACCLAACGLTDLADAHPYELSYPQRKLVALAATLAAGPAVVVLDEPTATLDARLAGRVESVLAGLQALGRTLVLVSHDVELLASHTDLLLVLRAGRVHRLGPTGAVLADPASCLGLPVKERIRRT